MAEASCPDFDFTPIQRYGWVAGAAVGGYICPSKNWLCKVVSAAVGAALADRLFRK